jgi:hypothetical protein
VCDLCRLGRDLLVVEVMVTLLCNSNNKSTIAERRAWAVLVLEDDDVSRGWHTLDGRRMECERVKLDGWYV